MHLKSYVWISCNIHKWRHGKVSRVWTVEPSEKPVAAQLLDGSVSLGEGEIEICRSSELSRVASSRDSQPRALADMRCEEEVGGATPSYPVLPSGPHTLASSTDAGVASEDRGCTTLQVVPSSSSHSLDAAGAACSPYCVDTPSSEAAAAAVTEGGGPRHWPSSCTASVGAAGAVNSTPRTVTRCVCLLRRSPQHNLSATTAVIWRVKSRWKGLLPPHLPHFLIPCKHLFFARTPAYMTGSCEQSYAIVCLLWEVPAPKAIIFLKTFALLKNEFTRGQEGVLMA